MQEIELKFQIPAGQTDAVRQALRALAAGQPEGIQHIQMLAAYFDTPDRALARHKMALRVRQENEAWVQTFKAAGADAMSRIEDNQPMAAPHGELRPDLSLHRLPAARQALLRALPGLADGNAPAAPPDHAGLGPVYQTRFQREQIVVVTPEGRVAICLDDGQLVAGALNEPLAELEFELVAGQAEAVIHTARPWVDRFGVWLDVHSKAYRGTRLAGAAMGGPAGARPVPAPAVPGSGGAVLSTAPLQESEARAFVAQCTEAAAANWSEVAGLRPGWRDAAEHWHACLSALLAAGDCEPAVLALMPAAWWDRTRALKARVVGILPNAGHDGAAPAKAAGLAMAADTTHWALDALAAIKR